MTVVVVSTPSGCRGFSNRMFERLVYLSLIISIKNEYEQAARVRVCNSVNLKPGGIIEPLLKVVNILRMCP